MCGRQFTFYIMFITVSNHIINAINPIYTDTITNIVCIFKVFSKFWQYNSEFASFIANREIERQAMYLIERYLSVN